MELNTNKMNNNIFFSGRIYLVLLTVFLFTSCKKYLDKKSDNTLVVPQTVEDLQALLDDADKMNYSTSIYAETTSDDYFLTDATFNSSDNNNRSAYLWIPFDYSWQNEWADAYLAVYNSNICLETIEKIAKTGQNNDKWNNVKGSALFYRSYYLLSLVWTYAKAYDLATAQTDPGIPVRTSSDFNIPSERGNVQVTYDKIISDTKSSLQYLPDNPQHVMRPSKAAAYGLLARAYLSMRQYDSALKYSDLTLQIKNQLIDLKTINVTSAAPFVKFNSETIFYSEEDSQSFLYNVYNYISVVDSNLYNSFSNNDLRKAAYFAPQGTYQSFKANYSNSYQLFSGIATDEMYLIRAECYARKGDKTSALIDLNSLLVKKYDATFSQVTATDANSALARILVERRKELVFRGLRWIDIKRLNKEGANIIPKRLVAGQIYSLPPNDKKYALPLPTDVIQQSGIAQN